MDCQTFSREALFIPTVRVVILHDMNTRPKQPSLSNQSGISLVEYALIIALVILGLVWFSTTFVSILENSYQNHNEEFNYINTQTAV